MRNARHLLALAILALGASAATAADLQLEVSGVRSAEGEVLVAVYAKPADWLKQPVAVRKSSAREARDGKLVFKFTGLPDGVPLAVSTFHDLNRNGELDMNPFGMPTEPYAFSRQAQGKFSAPSFEQAALPVGTSTTSIELP